jgi:hypothetical protein
MATEVHGYIKTFLVIGAIFFACGGYAMIVNGNTERLGKVEEVNITQGDKITALQLADKDLLNMAEKNMEYYSTISLSLKSISSIQAGQAILLDRNTIKLETLTKD